MAARLKLMDGEPLAALLVTRYQGPQEWIIQIADFTLATQALSDRAEHAKLAEGSPRAPDGAWIFQKDLVSSMSLAGKSWMSSLQKILEVSNTKLELLVKEARQPDFEKDILEARRAVLGALSLDEKTEAPPLYNELMAKMSKKQSKPRP